MENNLHIGECSICGRELIDPVSVARGIGPVCARKLKNILGARVGMDDVYLESDIRNGFIFNRWDSGTPATNVPHLIVCHSLDGFEWGYAGSGPADLALNICEIVIKRIGWKGGKVKDIVGNSYSQLAWNLHQKFKREFVAKIPAGGGRIAYEDVLRWIYKHLVKYQQTAYPWEDTTQ